jgi:hypothetical protein
MEFSGFVTRVWNEVVRSIAKAIARIYGLFGQDSDGMISIIDEDFDRKAKKILDELNAAKTELEKIKSEALARARSAKDSEAAADGSVPDAAPGSGVPASADLSSLEPSRARSVGSFSAAAFAAESGGLQREMQSQAETMKKIAAQLIENQRQAHEDMQRQNRIIQESGAVFS